MKMASFINRQKKINLLEYMNRLNSDIVKEIRSQRIMIKLLKPIKWNMILIIIW